MLVSAPKDQSEVRFQVSYTVRLCFEQKVRLNCFCEVMCVGLGDARRCSGSGRAGRHDHCRSAHAARAADASARPDADAKLPAVVPASRVPRTFVDVPREPGLYSPPFYPKTGRVTFCFPDKPEVVDGKRSLLRVQRGQPHRGSRADRRLGTALRRQHRRGQVNEIVSSVNKKVRFKLRIFSAFQTRRPGDSRGEGRAIGRKRVHSHLPAAGTRDGVAKQGLHVPEPAAEDTLQAGERRLALPHIVLAFGRAVST